jgi:hypothetical protein
MRFMITMNMPNGYGDKMVHQITFEYPSESFEDFVKTLLTNEIVIGDEYHFDKFTKQHNYAGRLALNWLHVGKIKEL